MKIVSVDYIKGVPSWDQGPLDALPEVAMLGRSNVGKSSLINFLLGRKKSAYVSRTPGKTQLIHFFLINRAFYLVDLPGYGYARTPRATREGWGPMITSYLLKRQSLSAVALLIDMRRPDSPLDSEMTQWLNGHQIATLVFATKADKITMGKRKAQVDAIKRAYGIPALIVTSALKKEGREEAWREIEKILFPLGP